MPAASGAKKNSSASNAGRSYSKTKRAFLVKALFCVLYKLELVDVIVRTRTPFDALLCGTCFYGLVISTFPFWPQQQG